MKLVHVLGDKRDHFESMKDPWEMFRVVLDERKRREIDPTLALLRECLAESREEKNAPPYAMERLRDLASFFEATTRWYEQISSWPAQALAKFIALGGKVRKLVGGS